VFELKLASVSRKSLCSSLIHKRSSMLSLLYTLPSITFPAAEHHHPLASAKLYCWVTEA